MCILRTFVLSFALCVILCSSAFGQAAEVVQRHDRVRFVMTGEQVSGRVTALTDTTLSVVVDREDMSGVITVPHYKVAFLEVAKQRSRWRKALIGAGIGATPGLALLGYSAITCRSNFCGVGRLFIVLFYVIPPTMAGGLIGAILPPGYRWEDARLSTQLGVRYDPRFGSGLTLRIRW